MLYIFVKYIVLFKQTRRIRLCPECGKKIKYMTSHLEKYHKMPKEEAKTLSAQHRAVRKGVVHDCEKMICRVYHQHATSAQYLQQT